MTSVSHFTQLQVVNRLEVSVDAASKLRNGRALQALEGDQVVLSQWTCKDGCTKPHEEEHRAPNELMQRPHCFEAMQGVNLHVREDVDLGCLGSSISCEDIQLNETLRMPKKVYSDCTLDEELLRGECHYMCKHKTRPTRRCDYWFDRNNKYGMHKDKNTGKPAYRHCAFKEGRCNSHEHAQTNYMICKKSNSTLAGMRSKPTKDSGVAGDIGTGALIGAAIGGAVFVLLLVLFFWYFCIKGRKGAADNVPASGPVVVGRPVDESDAAVAPPQLGVVQTPTSSEKGQKIEP